MKSYNYRDVESKYQNEWEKIKINAWDESQLRNETFVIDTPPPTVSGYLHIGHVFSYVQTDFIARFQRMRGKNVFYPIGFDDNGLPTERYVEKLQNVRAMQMERKEFMELCENVSMKAEDDFRKLFKSIALSIDWSQQYRTISKRSCHIAQLSFLDLYHKGHIKRDSSPVFWDIVDRTAIAQTEIEDRQESSVTNEISFFSLDGKSEFIISTTRPELIASCAALLYNPNDIRYNKLNLREVVTPIFNKKIPVIADHDVVIEKGTGLVMCCTFGDIQDLYWQKRYNLEIKQCIDLSGKMQNSGILDGLTVNQAREKILTILKENGLLKKQIDIVHTVKCAERSGAILELIPTDQWYIIVMDKKKKLIEKTRQCVWHPDYMRIRLENWINGLNQEWCISRQRYSGIPFPIWYSKRSGEEGRILIATKEQLPVNPTIDLPYGYEKHEVIPDIDVMDTWATSAISPQLSSWGITKEYSIDNERHSKLFPADLRPNGHDIIRTWDFCTIVKSLLHENTIPWRNVMINGWCMTTDKVKMSKSKKNAISPLELLEEKGADVVRYWASTATLGTDIIFSEEKFQAGRKLVNKLWNAGKFCHIHTSDIQNSENYENADFLSNFIKNRKISHFTDLWIINKLNELVKKATEAFENFEYYNARSSVESFFWNDFCDNYLELVKKRIYSNEEHFIKKKMQHIDGINNDKSKDTLYSAEYKNSINSISAKYTIFYTFQIILKLFAPFIPHVTEEIYQNIYVSKTTDNTINKEINIHNNSKVINSIHAKNKWPSFKDFVYDDEIVQAGDTVITLLELIRKFKSEHSMPLNSNINEVNVYTDKAEKLQQSELYSDLLEDLQNACNITNLKIEKSQLYVIRKESENISSVQLKDIFIDIRK